MRFIYTLLLLLISSALIAQEDTDTLAPDLIEPGIEESLVNEAVEEIVTRSVTDLSQKMARETVNYLRLLQRENEAIKETNEESSISGLYLPDNTGEPQGGILILHDVDQHAHWPDSVAPLREYLPDYGWSTLSIFFGSYLKKPLPEIIGVDEINEIDDAAEPMNADDPDKAIPTTVAATNENEEQDIPEEETPIEDQNFESEANADELDQLAESFEAIPTPSETEVENPDEALGISPEQAFMTTMVEQVEGGLQQLNTLGQFNLVIIAHGVSANWAVKTLKERLAVNTNTGGYSLIMVNAKTSAYPSYMLNEELAKLEIPILDLYTSNTPEAMPNIVARRNAVVRQKKAQYMQIRLPAIDTIYGGKQNMITRRVRGWLKTYAEGEVVLVK
jgi:hypothetical protein